MSKCIVSPKLQNSYRTYQNILINYDSECDLGGFPQHFRDTHLEICESVRSSAGNVQDTLSAWEVEDQIGWHRAVLNTLIRQGRCCQRCQLKNLADMFEKWLIPPQKNNNNNNNNNKVNNHHSSLDGMGYSVVRQDLLMFLGDHTSVCARDITVDD